MVFTAETVLRWILEVDVEPQIHPSYFFEIVSLKLSLKKNYFVIGTNFLKKFLKEVLKF
jgi:hypothetical protein